MRSGSVNLLLAHSGSSSITSRITGPEFRYHVTTMKDKLSHSEKRKSGRKRTKPWYDNGNPGTSSCVDG